MNNDLKEMIDLWKSGWGIRRLAKRYNITRFTVMSKLMNEGWDARQRARYKEQNK